MPKIGLTVVTISVGVLLIVNGHLLFGYTLVKTGNVTLCAFSTAGFKHFYLYTLTWIDLVLGFILPVLCIIFSNIATVVKYFKSTIAREEVRKGKNYQLLRITFLVSVAIRIACPCVLYPRTPHFYIVKLDYRGIHFFLFLRKKT